MFTQPLRRLAAQIGVARRPLADLRRALDAYWDEFADRHEELAAHGWFDSERPVADRLARPGVRVLVVGAGSGRELVPLAQAGCIVSAIEPAAHALAQARLRLSAAGVEASLSRGYVEEEMPRGPFDVAWFSWFTYSYIPGAQRRVAMLQRVAKELAPGGRVVISVVRGPFRSRVTDTARVISAWFPNDWRLEPGDHLTTEDNGQSPFIHHFTPGELDGELAAAGLRFESRHDEGNLVVAGRAG